MISADKMDFMARAGQPTKYKPEYCQALIEHMSQGYSFESFAAVPRVDRDTVYEWVNKHPEFSDAKKLGTSLGLKFWENLGLKAVHGEIPGFIPAVYIFSMKNRFGWTDKTPEERALLIQNNTHVSNVNIQQLPTQDLLKTVLEAREPKLIGKG